MAEKRTKSFGQLWIPTFGLTAGWMLLAYAVAIVVLTIVADGSYSLGSMAASALGGLLWTPVAYFFTGWATVPVVATVVTAVRYFRS